MTPVTATPVTATPVTATPVTATPAAAEAKPAKESKPAIETEKAEAPKQEKSKPAPTTGAATSTDRETKVAAASALTRPFAKDAAPTPVAPASTMGVFVGLAAAAVFLSGAFWAILLGGRQSA